MKNRFFLQMALFASVAIYFFANFQKIVVPGPIFDTLMTDFNSGAGVVAGLGASFMYSYAVVQLLAGPLVDRYGPGRLMLCGGLILCAGAAITPFTHSIPFLYIGRVMTSVGAGTIIIGLVVEIVRVYPDSYTAMGVCLMIGYFGGMAGGAPYIRLVEWAGWRMILAAAAAIMLLLYVSWVVLYRRGGGLADAGQPKPEKGEMPALGEYLEVIRNPMNRWLIVSNGMMFGVNFVIQTVIGQKFLQDFCMIGATAAGAVISVFVAIAAVAGLVQTWINRLCGDRPILMIKITSAAGLLAVAGLLLMVFCGCRGIVPAAGAFFLIALVTNRTPVCTEVIRMLNPDKIFGSSFSLANAACFLLPGLISNAVGWIMGCFVPTEEAGRMVYGRETYLWILLMLTAIEAAAFLTSLPLRLPGTAAAAAHAHTAAAADSPRGVPGRA